MQPPSPTQPSRPSEGRRNAQPTVGVAIPTGKEETVRSTTQQTLCLGLQVHWLSRSSIGKRTMASFAVTVTYGQCCRRHIVGQRIVSEVSVVRSR